ncbi:alpha-(1,3)-fucosyltransferase 10-like [Halichondria panicea]|uniref:alpha-(1,3)-fucosyltransferase 10-like n=1 Tax=Halichondria panicea TaxID=6063 RepID=UPI00312B3B20
MRCGSFMKRLLKLAVIVILLSVLSTIILDFVSDRLSDTDHENYEDDQPLFGIHSPHRQPPIYLPAEEPTDLPLIVWWTPFIPEDRKIRECSLGSCLITKSRTELSNPNTQVDVFMFYGSDLHWSDLPLPRKPRHMWALLNEESPKNNWVFATEKGISLFNLTSTYSRYSNYPIVLHYLHTLINLSQPQRVPTKDKSTGDLGLVMYMQSDCNPPSDRDSYIQELMKYVKVDSYGRCLHNRDLPEHLTDSLTFNAQDVIDLVAKYKFAISFENAVCHDYITEKFWRPLYAGTVPIVHGSPTIKDWAPTDHSIIVADDFASPKELAEFLLKLDTDDNKYNEYLEFKRSGITNQRLLEHYRHREWTVDDDDGLDFIDGFQCFVCNELHKRRQQQNPELMVANRDHCVCPVPEPFLKETGKTIEERMEKMDEEARDEMDFWRRTAGCAEEVAAVLDKSFGRGETQEELNQRIENECTDICARNFK